MFPQLHICSAEDSECEEYFTFVPRKWSFIKRFKLLDKTIYQLAANKFNINQLFNG